MTNTSVSDQPVEPKTGTSRIVVGTLIIVLGNVLALGLFLGLVIADLAGDPGFLGERISNPGEIRLEAGQIISIEVYSSEKLSAVTCTVESENYLPEEFSPGYTIPFKSVGEYITYMGEFEAVESGVHQIKCGAGEGIVISSGTEDTSFVVAPFIIGTIVGTVSLIVGILLIVHGTRMNSSSSKQLVQQGYQAAAQYYAGQQFQTAQYYPDPPQYGQFPEYGQQPHYLPDQTKNNPSHR